MERANKIKLGAFVLLSGALLIGGVLAVGITRVFEPKVRAVTVVNTSVEGLAPDTKAVVNFDTVGTKTLLLKFAKLLIPK